MLYIYRTNIWGNVFYNTVDIVCSLLCCFFLGFLFGSFKQSLPVSSKWLTPADSLPLLLLIWYWADFPRLK